MCVCYVVCVWKEEGKGGLGGGGVTTLPRVITNCTWGEEVTGPGRHSPMTSIALLTSVCKEGYHTCLPPPDIMP